jgi:ABC-2 type transport system permease protein
MTLGFSVAVLLVYFIVFNALSWLVFTRRDVAA